MSHPWLLEAALRSLVMGTTVFAALRLLRIRQVRAQRTAWVLALFAALAMPALVYWPVSLRVPSAWQMPVHAGASAVSVQSSGNPAAVFKPSVAYPRTIRLTAVAKIAPAAGTPRFHTVTSAISHVRIAAVRHQAAALRYASTLYVGVASLLLLRLLIGVALTLRLRNRAARTCMPTHPSADIRVSAQIATPFTIGASIVLPVSFHTWDANRLRMVLAHEQAHVDHADFYILLLAQVHCALYWFSPFSWFLQRRLSALGEALSDLAAIDQADSRSSYAQVLLDFAKDAFATHAQRPLAAVAMARSSNLRPRIERLLNDRLFHESYTGARRYAILAASIVPLALLSSASLVRVHAADERSVQQPTAPPATPELAPAVLPPAPEPPANPVALIPPVPDAGALAIIDNKMRREVVREQARNAVEQAKLASSMSAMSARMARDQAAWDGDSTALVTGDSKTTFNGYYDGHFDTIRSKVKGDFFYYRHDGKSYVIQDPAFLAQAKALYAPMLELGRQQDALGKQQEALGQQQEALGKRQSQVKVVPPDMSKELAELEAATQKVKQLQTGKEIDREALSNLQERMGDLQGRLGELQGEAGEQQGKLGEEQGLLGEQQGRLGEEQGRLGEQQGKLGEEAQRKLKPLIDQAIRDGKAKPLD